jgi:hypothetical protein
MMMLMQMEQKNKKETGTASVHQGQQFERRMQLLTEAISTKILPKDVPQVPEKTMTRKAPTSIEDELEKEEEMEKVMSSSKTRQEYINRSRKNIETALQYQNKNLLERMAVEAELLLWSETRNNMPTDISDDPENERFKKWSEIIESIRTPGTPDDDEDMERPEPLLKEVSVKTKSLEDLLQHKREIGLQELLSKLEILNDEERWLFNESADFIKDSTDCMRYAHDEIIAFVNPLISFVMPTQLPTHDEEFKPIEGEKQMNTALRIALFDFRRRITKLMNESTSYIEKMREKSQQIAAKNAILIKSLKREQVVAHRIEQEVSDLQDQLRRETEAKNEFKRLLEVSYHDEDETIKDMLNRPDESQFSQSGRVTGFSKSRRMQNAQYINTIQRRFQVEKDFLIKLIVELDKDNQGLKQKLRMLPHHQDSFSPFLQLHSKLKRNTGVAQQESVPVTIVSHTKPTIASEARSAPEQISGTTDPPVSDPTSVNVETTERIYSFSHLTRENEKLQGENRSLREKVAELQENITRIITHDPTAKGIIEPEKPPEPVEEKKDIDISEAVKQYMQMKEIDEQVDKFEAGVQTDYKLLRQLFGDTDSGDEEEESANLESVVRAIKKRRQWLKEQRSKKLEKEKEERENESIDTTVVLPKQPENKKHKKEDHSSRPHSKADHHQDDKKHVDKNRASVEKRKATPVKKRERKGQSPKREPIAKMPPPPPYFGDKTSVLDPMGNFKSYVNNIRLLLHRENYSSYTALEDQFYPRWSTFLTTQRNMLHELFTEITKQESQLIFEAGEAYKWLLDDFPKLLGDFDRMINMTDIHNTLMGIHKIEKPDGKKKGDKKAASKELVAPTILKNEQTIHSVVAEKVVEIMQVVDHEEKANKAMDLVKSLLEKIQLLEASRNRNRDYQLLLEKRMQEMVESMQDDAKGMETPSSSRWGAGTKILLALSGLKSECEALRVRCAMSQRTIMKYKTSLKTDHDNMFNAFNQIVLEVSDRDEFISMTRKFISIFSNAFTSLVESHDSDSYIILRNRLLKFNRGFTPKNDKLADSAFQFRGQVENLCSLLHKAEHLANQGKGFLPRENKEAQTNYTGEIEAGSVTYINQEGNDLTKSVDKTKKQRSGSGKHKKIVKEVVQEQSEEEESNQTVQNQVLDDKGRKIKKQEGPHVKKNQHHTTNDKLEEDKQPVEQQPLHTEESKKTEIQRRRKQIHDQADSEHMTQEMIMLEREKRRRKHMIDARASHRASDADIRKDSFILDDDHDPARRVSAPSSYIKGTGYASPDDSRSRTPSPPRLSQITPAQPERGEIQISQGMKLHRPIARTANSPTRDHSPTREFEEELESERSRIHRELSSETKRKSVSRSITGPWREDDLDYIADVKRRKKAHKTAKLKNKDMNWDNALEDSQQGEKKLHRSQNNNSFISKQRSIHAPGEMMDSQQVQGTFIDPDSDILGPHAKKDQRSKSPQRDWEQRRDDIKSREKEKALASFKLDEENESLQVLVSPDEYLPQPTRVPRKARKTTLKTLSDDDFFSEEEIEYVEPEPSTITSTQGSTRFQFAPHDAVLEQYLQSNPNTKNMISPARKRKGFFDSKSPMSGMFPSSQPVVDHEFILTSHGIIDDEKSKLPPIHKSRKEELQAEDHSRSQSAPLYRHNENVP